MISSTWNSYYERESIPNRQDPESGQSRDLGYNQTWLTEKEKKCQWNDS